MIASSPGSPVALDHRQLAIVSDLDATLWDDQQRIHPASFQALAALRDQGAHLVLATARGPHSSTRGLVLNRVRDVPVIALDGCVVVEADGTRRVHATLHPDSVTLLLGMFARHGLEPCIGIYSHHADQVLGRSPSTCQQHLEYVKKRAVKADLRRWQRETPVFSMQVRGRSQGVLGEAAEQIEKTELARVQFARDWHYGGWSITLSPLGVTKQTALSEWLHRNSLGRATVVAVGDGPNDLPLLRAADVAVAVETADKELLAEADAVIARPRDGGFERLPEIVSRLVTGARRPGCATRH